MQEEIPSAHNQENVEVPSLPPTRHSPPHFPTLLAQIDDMDRIVDTERGVNQYQVQFKTFFNLYLNHSTISNEK
jgi:hypothetical protein